jgi:23S rRNA-/tRNA-specific pseudouridylate synthase
VNILYQDPRVVAVDKPVGLSAIPERDRTVESLLSLLEKQSGQKLFLVHRIDKDVSGVMLFAKTAEAHRHLNLQFDRRGIHKTYLALVHGHVVKDQDTIDSPLREFGSGRMGVDFKRGKPSVTEYRVKERLGVAAASAGGATDAPAPASGGPLGRGYSLLEVSPRTGRRHQIRAHLYSIGHPIVGDRRYGDVKVQSEYPRLMLHAASIEFVLPGGERRVIESPVPDEFTAPHYPDMAARIPVI